MSPESRNPVSRAQQASRAPRSGSTGSGKQTTAKPASSTPAAAKAASPKSASGTTKSAKRARENERLRRRAIIGVVLGVIAIPWGLLGAFAPLFIYYGTSVATFPPIGALLMVLLLVAAGLAVPGITLYLGWTILRAKPSNQATRVMGFITVALGLIMGVAVLSGSLFIVLEAITALFTGGAA